MWILTAVNGSSLQKSENMFCLSRLMWGNCSTANFLTIQNTMQHMHYENEHRFRQTGLDRDSEHIQLSLISRPTSFHTNTWFPFATSFQNFLSQFNHIYHTQLPQWFSCRHALFYWPVTKLSALSIWNLVYSSQPVSVQGTSHLWPKAPKGLMPDNGLTLAPSCLV